MKYVLGPLIGKGSDGEVYDLIDKDDKERTIKFIQPTDYGFENYIEAYILLNLKHQNLMFSYEIDIEENGLTKIVQDKATCDLGKLIYGPKRNKINNSLRIKYIKQLISGISFLHSYNIVHGDIKPSNLLVVKDDLYLNDFSMSRLVKLEFMELLLPLENKRKRSNINERTNRKLYTFIYRAPECNMNKFSLKSDIYALGCTIYEIYYNQPYYSVSGDNRVYHIHAQNYYDHKNAEINELIRSMVINHPPENRINIETVCGFFDMEIPKKKVLNLCLSPDHGSKVFSNKIEHLVGRIRMNSGEKKRERKIFESGLKIFTVES